MNRRSLFASVAVAPMAMALPKVNELRVEQTSEERTIRTIVTAHTSPEAAEKYRRDWADSPYEIDGEWYVQSAELKQLPEELEAMPGSMMLFRSLEGEGAEEVLYLLGAFRRDFITVVSHLTDLHEAIMIDYGQHILRQTVPSPFAAAWSKASLRPFLPPESLLGPHATEEDGLWP